MTYEEEEKQQWESSVKGELDGVVDQILNRKEFKYDVNGDALYQQYKDQYTKQAQMAMEDTIGKAAALTGGYGNSYAQSVGQQAYNAHMGELNAVIPELYQLAYDKYSKETDDLYTKYSLLTDIDNREYDRYTTDEAAKAEAAKAEAEANNPFGNRGLMTFSRWSDDGKTAYYYGADGAEYEMGRGINPYTGNMHSDAMTNGEYDESKVFGNGYQPNNIHGEKLTKTGETDIINGKTQNIWKTPDETKYIWDGSQGMYLLYED